MIVWFKKWLGLLAGGAASVASSPSYRPVALEEILSFECARKVAEISPEDHQIGPLFQRAGFVVTSISTASGEPILLINGGAGTFSAKLTGAGVNRLRFSLPVNMATNQQNVFITYLHGGTASSRLFELTIERPPQGKDDLDFTHTPLQRAENLLPHLEYAIFETAERTLNQITNKRLSRGELGPSRPEACEHLARKQPALARMLRYDLEVIGALARGPVTRASSVAMQGGPSGRAPASARPN